MKRKMYSCYTKVLLTAEDKELLLRKAAEMSITESDIIRQLIRTLK